MSIRTIKVFATFQTSTEMEQRIYALNSNFLDCKLSDRLSQNTKIGLKTLFFHSTNVHLERASPRYLKYGLI